VRCRALSCDTPCDDPLLCDYHIEKIKVVQSYDLEFKLMWCGPKIAGLHVGTDDVFWHEIFTLEDLSEHLWVSEEMVGFDFTNVQFSTPIETLHTDYDTVDNWIQDPQNFEEVKLALEKMGMFVTDKGGQEEYRGIRRWNGNTWIEEWTM